MRSNHVITVALIWLASSAPALAEAPPTFVMGTGALAALVEVSDVDGDGVLSAGDRVGGAEVEGTTLGDVDALRGLLAAAHGGQVLAVEASGRRYFAFEATASRRGGILAVTARGASQFVPTLRGGVGPDRASGEADAAVWRLAQAFDESAAGLSEAFDAPGLAAWQVRWAIASHVRRHRALVRAERQHAEDIVAR